MRPARPVHAAFNQGELPRIAFIQRATAPLGVDFRQLCGALARYAREHVAPVWGVRARFVRARDFLPGAWALVLLDDADAPGALGYHELTPDGLPLAKVFIRPTRAAGQAVSLAASHELVEMLVDPAINLLTTGPDPKTMYAYESADPVEELSFPVDGLPMSDFVHPAYFESFRKPGSARFDHLGRVRRPFQVLAGGYQIVFKDGRWSEHFGSAAKARRFAREDRRGHRSEARSRGLLRRSTPARGVAQARGAT